MRILRTAVLSTLVSVALVVGGTTPVLAEPIPPTAPPIGTESTAPPTEAPETTVPPAEAPPAEAPQTTAPAPEQQRTAAPESEAPSAAIEAAAIPDPVTNIPSLFIELPPGYDLGDLNGSKDEIPADPDAEPHSIANLVDPTNAANNLENVTLEEIKGRGNFTWTLEKKPYQIKFDASTPVLGMETAKTWILLANHADPSFLRNKVAYDLAARFGLAGSPDSRFVDLVINGQYQGNYLISEKVEVKKNRLDLQHPEGVLLELDNNYGEAEDFYYRSATSNSLFVLKDAVDDVEGTDAQAGWVDAQAHINELDALLYAADPDWDAISAKIDVESFIKYYFVFELSANPEITQSSVYFWRDGPDDVLHAGPTWDFDSAFGSYLIERLGGDRLQDYIKNARFLRNQGNGWFVQLFRNPEFVTLVNETYENELEPLVEEALAGIDEQAALLPASATANFQRWPNVLGKPSVFTAGGRVVAPTWQGEVQYVRDWVERRTRHLEEAYGLGMPILQYAAHSASIGWQRPLTQGQIVGGPVNAGRQLEALDLKLLENTTTGAVQSNAHVQSIGWSGYKTGDTVLGTTGRGLQIEAFQFRLTGDLAARYDIQYRAFVQNIGWQSWVRNGETAGTTGRGLQIENVQIRLMERPPSSVGYSAHVATIGWMPQVSDGDVAGTTGRALRVEALRAGVRSSEFSGGLEYRGHVQSIGWQSWTGQTGFIGTTGRGLRLEAFQIRLTGTLAENYTIRYRAHVQDIGWQGWVTGGQTAGTTGQGKRIEAVRIELVPKN